MRRLLLLVKWLPYDSPLGEEWRAEQEKALKPTADKIRERQEHYARKAQSRREQEEGPA